MKQNNIYIDMKDIKHIDKDYDKYMTQYGELLSSTTSNNIVDLSMDMAHNYKRMYNMATEQPVNRTKERLQYLLSILPETDPEHKTISKGMVELLTDIANEE